MEGKITRIISNLYTVTTNGRHSGCLCFDLEQVEIHCSEEGCQFQTLVQAAEKKSLLTTQINHCVAHMKSANGFLSQWILS